MTENDIIRRCKKGNREAFNKLVEKYQSQVINIAYSMLSDKEDAYDAAQEVFIRVYKNIDSFQEKSSFTTWLYRITSNICSDILRKRQRNTNVVSISQIYDDSKDADLRDEGPQPEEVAEMTERQRAVRDAISELNSDYKAVITLCDIEGMSYDEISKVLGVPAGTVKSRINRARNSLRKILSEKRELF